MHAWVLQNILAKHMQSFSTVAASASRLSFVALQDLLQPQNSDLQIREGESGVFVAGVHEVEVNCTEDCLHLLQVGDRNRCTLKALWPKLQWCDQSRLILAACAQLQCGSPRT